MTIKQTFISSAELNYPRVIPSLDLNFAQTKTLDPRITFTRSSGGSYVGADGLIKYSGVNEARFDHDPVTGESLGLLIEQARTNRCLWSEDLSQGKSNVATPLVVSTNVETAPDGTLTADKLSITPAGLSNSESGMQFTVITSVVNQQYTLSCFLKMGEMRYVRFGSSVGISVSIDLLTGRIYSTVGIVNSFNIFPYPNGWYRVSFTLTATEAIGFSGRIIALNPTGTTQLFSGSGGLGFFIWGIQLEEGAFPISYIPTQASTRTREADIARINDGNFSNFFNPLEGTSFVSFKMGPSTVDNRHFLGYTFGVGGPPTILQRTGSAGDRHALSFTPVLERSIIVVITNTEQFTVPYIVGNSCFAYKSGDIAYSTRGGIQYTNNMSFPPLNNPKRPTTSLTISNPINAINGTISRVIYYPKRLSNEQIQALTK